MSARFMALTVKNFFVDTSKSIDLIKVTHEVRRAMRDANAENGTLVIVSPNAGAGFAILDASEKTEDVKRGLEPHAASGLLKTMLPKAMTIPFEKGKMFFEPWQEIFLVDYEMTAKRREFKVFISPDAPPAPAGGRGQMPGMPPGMMGGEH